MNKTIQDILEKENQIIDKGEYKVETPYYNIIISSNLKEETIFEFPITLIRKRIRPIARLPFKLVLGVVKNLKETGQEIMR